MAYNASILLCASALIDDLVESGSFSRTEVSACDYGVLNTCSGCAIIVEPTSSPIEPAAYGTSFYGWGLLIRAFIRDRHTATETKTAVWDMYQAIAGAVANGSNLDNRADRRPQLISLDHPTDVYYTFGQGPDWIPVTGVIRVFEEG